MRVIIAAAGTGGHINPGIAIANKIKEEEPDSEVIFVGTSRGLENDLVPRANYGLKKINAYGISRKISISNVKNIYKTIKSVGEAKKIIEDFKPDIVIGTGGYICGPVCTAANKCNIPVVLHESNAFPGVSVKLLAKKAKKVLVGFEDAKTRLPKAKKVVLTGTPNKIKDLNLAENQKNMVKMELGFSYKLPLTLVFGGSQGAKSINDSMIQIISGKLNTKYQIIWSVGKLQYDNIKDTFGKYDIDIDHIENVKIVPYIYNMEEVINAVDLVVSRSGAMTVNEICLVGKPAIFIPFPHAAENHQEYNAKVLEQANAAKIILDKDLTAEVLNKQINEIVNDKNKMKAMEQNAKRMAISDIENKIYKEIYDVVKRDKNSKTTK